MSNYYFLWLCTEQWELIYYVAFIVLTKATDRCPAVKIIAKTQMRILRIAARMRSRNARILSEYL